MHRAGIAQAARVYAGTTTSVNEALRLTTRSCFYDGGFFRPFFRLFLQNRPSRLQLKAKCPIRCAAQSFFVIIIRRRKPLLLHACGISLRPRGTVAVIFGGLLLQKLAVPGLHRWRCLGTSGNKCQKDKKTKNQELTGHGAEIDEHFLKGPGLLNLPEPAIDGKNAM